MKHFISLVLAGVMTAVSVTFSSSTVTAETEHHGNVLITYFSRAGENYNVGVVERGNTDLLAGIVSKQATAIMLSFVSTDYRSSQCSLFQ